MLHDVGSGGHPTGVTGRDVVQRVVQVADAVRLTSEERVQPQVVEPAMSTVSTFRLRSSTSRGVRKNPLALD
jgi:hypothetical protein